MQLVVIGGSDAGISAALRALELRGDVEVRCSSPRRAGPPQGKEVSES
jgi:hypothetical protein